MMKLIGMLDSPYVRRVAVSLKLYDIAFEHQSLSVFRHFDEFTQINPAVKAPTLVVKDGTVLMDSSLILNYIEDHSAHKLMPTALSQRTLAFSILGFALAACEKAIQRVYEFDLRPEDKRYQPWIDRITLQLHNACTEWEKLLAVYLKYHQGQVDQVMVTSVVCWTTIQKKLPDMLVVSDFPVIQNLTESLEKLPAFQAYPYAE